MPADDYDLYEYVNDLLDNFNDNIIHDNNKCSDCSCNPSDATADDPGVQQ